MADPKIFIRRSATPNKVPTTDQLALGELAINTYDGKLYLEQDQGGVGVGTTIISVNPWNVGVGSLAYDVYFTAGDVGIGITDPTSKLHVVGNTLVTGVVTASSFSGNASSATYATNAGVATYATNAGVATALQNSRTFEITGDVVATAISFDGTGNVSLAATIQPNSVALGSDTTGDYVQTITGTTNQITVTSGTGESSTPTLSIPNQFTAPQDVEVTRDLQVNRNLNVNGNITIGGTSASLFTNELRIYDPDIVLGFRTDAFGNDVSNDNTANHGGVALASTEGNPLVQLFIAGIETAPATYKKIMWFKAGEFAGLGTDAWLFNYAVGIGSTQFPTGTRLAAGSVQFTENDLAVVRNINASGITTSSRITLNGANNTAGGGGQIYLNGATGNRIDFNTNGVAAPAFTTRSAGTKIVLYPNLSGSSVDFGFGIEGSTLWSSVGSTVDQFKWYAGTTNIATLTGGGNFSVSNNILLGTSVSGGTATPSYIDLGNNYSNGSTRDKCKIYLYNSGSEQYGFSIGSIGDVQYHSNAYHDFYIANNSAVRINSNRNLLVGSQTDTNTASQKLQVTGGAYVSGSVGIGITNPTYKFEVSESAYSRVTLTQSTTGKQWQIGNDGYSFYVFSVSPNVRALDIDGTGNVLINNTTATGTSSQPLQVTGGAYVSGNLGVGVTNPTNLLTVNNTGQVADYVAGYFGSNAVASGESRTWITIQKGNLGGNYGGAIGGYLIQGIGGGLIFGTQNSTATPVERSRIDTSGNLLINSTSATGTASQPLQVTGGAYVSGNTGIGITNPSYALHVRTSSSAVVATLESTNSGGDNVQLRFKGTNGEKWAIGNNVTTGGTGTNFDIFDLVSGAGRLRVDSTGNVGINTTNPSYKLHVVGSFAATTKSFVIDHPTKEGMKLRYGSLEGPENGVYVRGRIKGNTTIELPDYWVGLVHEDSITVNLTPIGDSATPRVKKIENNQIEIFSKEDGEIDCFYTVFAERKDVDKLEVEF